MKYYYSQKINGRKLDDLHGLMAHLAFSMFLLLASPVGSHWRVPGVIATSLLCTILFSGMYSLHRSKIYFHCGWAELLVGWVRPSWQFLLIFAPLAVAVWFMGSGLLSLRQLVINGLLTAIVGVGLFLRVGLPPGLISDLGKRLPRPAGCCDFSFLAKVDSFLKTILIGGGCPCND